MFPSSLSLGLVLLPFVFATVHDVTVGVAGSLKYSPEAISATVGDQVVFHFYPKNHTVSQSSFANPCGRAEGGFSSGFQPVPANQTDNFPTYTITINDTQPVWVYCGQGAGTPASHCGQGMVFAVNCGADGTTNSFTNFQNAALAVGASLSAAAAASTTAAYGGYTIPPAPTGTQVTQAITLGSSTWTTTYTSYPNSPAPTPAAVDGQIHTVVVGGSSLIFDPSHISAQPRDTVVFEFHQKNHTVTQSAFSDPCRKLNESGVTGFDSGFMPVAANATTFPTWNYTVTDTSPVWAYCRQKTPESHCGQGMVFAINSDESSASNFSAFQSIAIALNGTSNSSSTSTSTSTSPSSSASSAASTSTRLGSPGVVLIVVSVLLWPSDPINFFWF
jgi:plastocyanin